MLSFPGTGIQLAVSDTDTAPEGLFFELVKPPHHGIVLKYSADVQELMREGEWRLLPSLRITRNLHVPGTGKVIAFPLCCQLLSKCPHNSQPWQDGIKSHLSS